MRPNFAHHTRIMKEQAPFDHFASLDVRIGTITKAEVFDKARKPAYKLWIDFGPEVGMRKSSAQITEVYEVEALVGKQVVAVLNFGEKQIADFMSQCLVLGTYTDKGVVLLKPDVEVVNGSEIG